MAPCTLGGNRHPGWLCPVVGSVSSGWARQQGWEVWGPSRAWLWGSGLAQHLFCSSLRAAIRPCRSPGVRGSLGLGRLLGLPRSNLLKFFLFFPLLRLIILFLFQIGSRN